MCRSPSASIRFWSADPIGHRGAEYLVEHWDEFNYDARRQAFYRHCGDIKATLFEGGIHNWLPAALAVVLENIRAGEGSWVDQLFSTRAFCKRKNILIGDLRDVANAEWGVDLAEHALVQVGLSHRMYQSLRNAFNKSIYTPVNTTDELDSRSGMYTPRPWYVCPVLGTRFNLPEPLPPLYKTLDRMKESLAPMGLVLSSDGKISERPLLSTLRETFKRDRDVLKVFDVQRPAHPCFGIDHATISGARDFTQGGVTMGGCYKSGSLLSEQKHVTLCVGRYHDDGSGLAAILGPKPERGVVGIANEFRMLSDSGLLDMGDGTSIPCEPVVCLDMAAWRGITRKRGKCAAVCACRGLEKLQSYPGANGIPDLPTGETLADFHMAQSIARDQCAYGTAKMELPSLQDATHLLPEGWDFDRDGPWSCSWCDEVIYTTLGQQLNATTALAALRARASHGAPDDRKAAKKELDLKLKEHAELHGDAILFGELIMTNASGTKPFIIDPMHCLELNLIKHYGSTRLATG